MSPTVTITEARSGFANVPASYVVGDRDDQSSHLMSSATYELPEGCWLWLEAEICDRDGIPCEIFQGRNGGPCIVTSDGVIALRRVDN